MKEKIKTKMSARDCAYIAVFVALLIGVQLALSAIPGVELVTVLLVVFSFVFGKKRGMMAATAFSLLRQLVFGFFPNILLLYLLYYNALAWIFGCLGKNGKVTWKRLGWLILVACLCTAAFSLLDVVITSIWYGYTMSAMKVYFYATIPFMVVQMICTAVSMGVLFLPLSKVLA